MATHRDATADAIAALRTVVEHGDLRAAAELLHDVVPDPETSYFVRRLLIVARLMVADTDDAVCRLEKMSQALVHSRPADN